MIGRSIAPEFMFKPDFTIEGYDIHHELGVGGMATVYLATQRSLKRKVAIKVMKRGMGDANAEDRFQREGELMARLQHRNIVSVFDIVQRQDIGYIAMEYLPGGTLSDRMRDGLSLSDAVAIVVQMSSALQQAHNDGIVHRDLKPSNIMFRTDGTPVLTDFGIARAYDSSDKRLTMTGMFVGTPTYMSPEQAQSFELDGRSDQYSLGVMFYEMLTGSPPFAGGTPMSVAMAHVASPPPPLPPAFASIQPIMDRLLAKSPQQRYAKLGDFVRDLKASLTGSRTLMQQLRLDPSESASEQLRALGFSDSQINTAGRRVPLPNSANDPNQTRIRAAAPRRWLIPTLALAAVLVLGVAVWGVFGGGSTRKLDPVLERIVSDTLAQADQLIAQGKLVPPGDNAYDKLQDVLQVAPDYPAAQLRIGEILVMLKQKADQALAAHNFDAASTFVSRALIVAENDPDLPRLQKSIAAARIEAETGAVIADLLKRSRDAQQAGRLHGEGGDNALALARQALDIAPDHAAAKQQFAQIVTQSLSRATSELASGRLDETQSQLDATSTWLAAEPEWKALEKSLADARTAQQQQQRIHNLLTIAQLQVKSKHYAQPPGDNALETLARLAELDASNAPASTLRQQIGAELTQLAQAAEKQGNNTTALQLYDDALRAQPGSTQAATAKTALQQRMGEREKNIAEALGKARDALNEHHYLSPRGNNAFELLGNVLKLDPANADARRLLDGLPELVRNDAAVLGKDAQYDKALALLSDASTRYPNDTRFATQTRELQAERNKAQRADQRKLLLEDLQALVATNQFSAESARAVSGKVTELLRLDPTDKDALQHQQRYLDGFSAAIASAEDLPKLAKLKPALEAIRSNFGNAAPASLASVFTSAEQTLERKEAERIAAISGWLVLNAQPWANVESVVNETSNETIALPAERATPLRLSLPAGTYQVRFRHPTAKAKVLPVTVEARKTQTANATFSHVGTSDFLKRAGYAQ